MTNKSASKMCAYMVSDEQTKELLKMTTWFLSANNVNFSNRQSPCAFALPATDVCQINVNVNLRRPKSGTPDIFWRRIGGAVLLVMLTCGRLLDRCKSTYHLCTIGCVVSISSYSLSSECSLDFTQ